MASESVTTANEQAPGKIPHQFDPAIQRIGQAEGILRSMAALADQGDEAIEGMSYFLEQALNGVAGMLSDSFVDLHNENKWTAVRA